MAPGVQPRLHGATNSWVVDEDTPVDVGRTSCEKCIQTTQEVNTARDTGVQVRKYVR